MDGVVLMVVASLLSVIIVVGLVKYQSQQRKSGSGQSDAEGGEEAESSDNG